MEPRINQHHKATSARGREQSCVLQGHSGSCWQFSPGVQVTIRELVSLEKTSEIGRSSQNQGTTKTMVQPNPRCNQNQCTTKANIQPIQGATKTKAQPKSRHNQAKTKTKLEANPRCNQKQVQPQPSYNQTQHPTKSKVHPKARCSQKQGLAQRAKQRALLQFAFWVLLWVWFLCWFWFHLGVV